MPALSFRYLGAIFGNFPLNTLPISQHDEHLMSSIDINLYSKGRQDDIGLQEQMYINNIYLYWLVDNKMSIHCKITHCNVSSNTHVK